MEKIGFWAYVGENAKSTRFEIRVGSAADAYREYRYTGEIYDGWTYCEFTIASPTSTEGVPDMAAVDYIWVGYYYDASESNTSWLLDSIYAYTDPNHTNGTWGYINNSNLYGIATPSTNGIIVNQNNRPNSGNHGRILYSGEDSPNTFRITVGVKKICDDTSGNHGWARILWDFVDGFNYSGVYFAGGYNVIGVQQGIDNVFNNGETDFTFEKNRLYNFDISCTGNNVSVFVDGIHRVSYTMTQPRTTGKFTLESWAGSAITYPKNTTTIEFSNFKVYY